MHRAVLRWAHSAPRLRWPTPSFVVSVAATRANWALMWTLGMLRWSAGSWHPRYSALAFRRGLLNGPFTIRRWPGPCWSTSRDEHFELSVMPMSFEGKQRWPRHSSTVCRLSSLSSTSGSRRARPGSWFPVSERRRIAPLQQRTRSPNANPSIIGDAGRARTVAPNVDHWLQARDFPDRDAARQAA